MAPTPDEPAAGTAPRDSTPRWELWFYLAAAISYVGCGFFVKQIFAWWWFGAAWFVLFVWFAPRLAARVRRLRPVAPELARSGDA